MLDDPVAAIVRSAEAGLDRILTIVYPLDPKERASIDAVESWRVEAGERLVESGVDVPVPEIAVAAGIHPHEARHFGPEALEILDDLADGVPLAAIGETGLDYHYDHSPREDQRVSFEQHLEFATRRGLPVIVHLREAHDEGFEILERVGPPPAGCVIHCFSEGPEWARRYLDLGCYVSFAGTATFKKAEKIREAAAVTPLDRILIETDCPFLAPVPYRGRPNEPAFSLLTAAKIAEVKGLALDEVAAAARANAIALFWPRGRG